MSNTPIILNWNKVVDLGLTEPERKLDIFFQPGLSWVKETTPDDSTKVIALFFLENDPSKGEPGKDFQRLVKAMLRWIWAAAGNNPATPKSPEYFYQLYEAFLTQPFDYADFIKFLKKNFIFQIHEPTKALEGTIFPMFPDLILDVGKNPNTTPAQFPITLQGLQAGIGNLTPQFANDFDFGTETSVVEESAREFIFEDYGQLLLRTALQELREFLPPMPEPPTVPPVLTMETVISSLESVFDQLASIASRFLLHGLRLPVSNPLSVKPLFEATGQQFNLKTARENGTSNTAPEHDYTIKLARPPALSGFLECFSVGSPTASGSLGYNIDLTESTDNTKYSLTAMIETFKKVQGLAKPLKFDAGNGVNTGILPIPFYRYQNRIYSMRKWIEWDTGVSTPPNPFTFIMQVPTSLRQYLDGTTVNPAISLCKIPGGQQEAKTLDNKIDKNKYNWAVQIEIMARQIFKRDEKGFVTGVFELADISESQINLLESVLLDNHLGDAHIKVLSQSASGEQLVQLPGNLADFTLMRHNFSTNGSLPALNPSPSASISLPAANSTTREADNKQFLRLLWEGATIESGGYFFVTSMNQTEQSNLFSSKESILLSLLIEYDIIGDPIFDFHNSVIIQLDSKDFFDNNLILAVVESDSTANANYDVPVLAMPPGFIGFKYETTEPKTDPVELILLAEATFRKEPLATAGVIGSSLPANTKVNVFNVSKDGKWVFAANLSNGEVGWLPIKTEIPAAGNNPASTIEHLDVPPDLNQNQALAELKSLYHLLGYGKAGDPLVKNLPIGPLEAPEDVDDDWIYEKLIPAHAALGVANVPWPATAPPFLQNPYRGITANSSLSFEYWWQDIYGNKITKDTVSKTFDVRYTDPLIGINQWPSLSEQYQFVPDGLEIDLTFSTAPYADLKPGISSSQKNVLTRRLKADLIVYQKIYYQLQGPGVNFSIKTSLDDVWTAPLPPNQNVGIEFLTKNPISISNFVLKIYEYLSGLNDYLPELDKNPVTTVQPTAYAGSSILFKIDTNKLVPKAKFIQGISCWMIMHRDKKLVHPDLKDNPKLTNIYENQATLSPKHESVQYIVQPNQTLNSVAKSVNSLPSTVNPIEAADLVLQHRSVPSTVQGGIAIAIDNLKLQNGVEFGEWRKQLAEKETLLIGQTDSVTGLLITRTDGLYEPTSRKVHTLEGDNFDALSERINQEMKAVFGHKYPVEFTLPIFCENFKTERPFLKKDTILTIEPLNLRNFAQNFTDAFPDFHIAVSEERNAGGGQANTENNRPEFLFAVQMGTSGISYDIEEQDPNFYGIPPIATTLFSGKAKIFEDPKNQDGENEKEVEGIDANPLARDFLAALEEMLEPEILMSVRQLDEQPTVLKLLEKKAFLASKIAKTIAPILKEDGGDLNRLNAAKEILHQRLLNNLLEGFDIESVVQYDATVMTGSALPPKKQAGSNPPRMVGKAKVLRVRVGEDPNNREIAEADDLDYTLSSGYFELDQQDGQSAISYLFDTKTPDKFGNLEIEMEFQPLEMEFNLTKFPDVNANFKSSNKLRFILPANLNVYRITSELSDSLTKKFGSENEFKNSFGKAFPDMIGKNYFSLAEFEATLQKSLPGKKTLNDAPYRKYCDALLSKANPNYMGRTDVPIPLRYYPLSPSLILHQAEADESSREFIRDLREWQYSIIYEHPEVAQDSIDCIVKFNVPDSVQVAGNDNQPEVEVPEFVRLLLNFKENLPEMKKALAPLKEGTVSETDAEDAISALQNFTFLTEKIAENWVILQAGQSEFYEPNAEDLHFEISEETLTFVDDTTEAETREGIVITRAGLTDAALKRLNKSFVERAGVPSATELRKNGILKRGTGYLKKVIPKLELPGYFKARAIRLEADFVEQQNFKQEELDKMGITKKGIEPEHYYDKLAIPNEELPGFMVKAGIQVPDNPDIKESTTSTPESRTFFFAIDRDDQTFFGDSSIPDRKFSIENLDLLQQQNAWASIWLSRNKHLVFGKTTNRDFIFRTPAVRFTNRTTPLIINHEPWDIATLPAGKVASKTTLIKHVSNMLKLFEPGISSFKKDADGRLLRERYELQISCRYTFAMARGSGLNEDLVTTLPIMLGLRLSPDQLAQYPTLLSKEISTWFKTHLPVEENAALNFSVEAFSQLDPLANTSLPLLRVTYLTLQLEQISNMPDIRVGKG